ncbi:hypothetical protein TRAPUB_689 [Trametes pubescens]|uniref:Uncharacterized protein n=1 Tax=Trametes pubescens TaxID=154538 RepID=A0A1M2VLA5_TRAPU|nr:hypothetical protein TRAPUB_689 [Trametes pubescens]
MGNLTKKQLEALVDDLRKDIETLYIAQTQLDEDLEAANGTILEQREALTAAEEAIAAARTHVLTVEAERDQVQVQLHQAQQNLAAAPPAAEAPAVNAGLPDIPRPNGNGWSIREAMDLDRVDYAEIQRTVRSLVIRSQLDWTDDFRRQDADKLATMFRAARKSHPVLRRYINNWATAAIARQYMQNKRKHAYKQGYIKKKPNAADQSNQRRPDEDDSMGGAAAGLGQGAGTAAV